MSGSFEDKAIFHVIQISYDGGEALCAHHRSIDKFVQKIFKNAKKTKKTKKKKKKINTVHNLITFSIVFTKKNFFFFFRPKNLMNLYSKTFYILNFQKKKKFMVK